MSIMPPPIVQKPRSWDDCHCQCAQDRFYDELGFESRYRWLDRIGRLKRLLAWRPGRPHRAPQLTKPAAGSSC